MLTRKSDASPDQPATSLVRSDTDRPSPGLASRLIVGLLGLTLVLCTLAFGGVHYWALGFLSIGAAVTIVLWSADAWSTRELRFRASWLQLPLAVGALIGLVQLLPLRRLLLPGESTSLATPLSFDPYATRLAVVLIVILLTYFAAALAYIDSRARLRLIAGLIIVFGVVVALLGLTQHFLSPLKIYGIREPYQALPFGPFVDRNHFAAFVVMILPLPLALLLERAVGQDRILLYAFAVLVLSVAAVMTGSRAGLLTLVLTIAFLLIVRALTRPRVHAEGRASAPRGRWRRRTAVVSVAAAGLVLTFSLILLLGGADPLRRIMGRSASEDESAGGRQQYWAATLRMIRSHPVTGVGLDAFGVAFPQYDSLNGTYRVERAHNDYLQTVAETGLVGSLCALLFIVILLRQGLTLARTAHDPWRRAISLGSLAGCFGVLVHSFFEFPLRTPANALLFLLLAVLATVEVGSRHAPRPETAMARPD